LTGRPLHVDKRGGEMSTEVASGGIPRFVGVRCLVPILATLLSLGACSQGTRSASHFNIVVPEDTRSEEFQRAAVAYGDSLKFLDHSEVRGTSDKQYLEEVVVDSNSDKTGVVLSGCIGTIRAEKRANKNGFDALRGTDLVAGDGRITAVIEIRQDTLGPICDEYQSGELLLRPGRNYVWVYDFEEVEGAGECGHGKARAQAIVIPDSLGVFPVYGPVDISICIHRQYTHGHSLARWIFDDADALTWWDCGKNACCNGQ